MPVHLSKLAKGAAQNRLQLQSIMTNTTMKVFGGALLAVLALTGEAFSFLPSALHHRHRPLTFQRTYAPLLAEAKNSSELAHEQVEDYRSHLSQISRKGGDNQIVSALFACRRHSAFSFHLCNLTLTRHCRLFLSRSRWMLS